MRSIVLAFALLFSAEAGAQTSQPAPGTRVRFFAPGAAAGRVEAVVVATPPESLVVAATRSRTEMRLPLSAIERLQVYGGRSMVAGAATGLKWGLGIGVPWGIAMCGFSDHSGSDVSCVGTGALIGAAVGTVAGALIRGETWK